MSINRISTLDVNNFKISEPKTRDGRTSVFINNNEQQIFVQTPKLKAPFGYNSNAKFNPVMVNHTLPLTLDADTERFFQSVDELVLSVACKNKKKWFGNKVTNNDMVKAMYSPLVKVASDPNYPNRISPKVFTKNGVPAVSVYDDKELCSGDTVSCIIKFNSIFIIAGRFGLTISVEKIKIAKSSKQRVEFLVDSDSSECE